MPTTLSRVAFDVPSMQLTTKSFARKLSILIEYGYLTKESLKKLQIVNSELKIDNGYFQSIRRWWNNQSRYELYKYLRDELNEYALFLEMVNISITRNRYDKEIITVRDDNLEFVKSIIPGLKLILELYPEYEMLSSTIYKALNSFDSFIVRHHYGRTNNILIINPNTQKV